MHFKQTLLAIVLMVAFFPAFGSRVEWRGRYTGGSYLEGPKRFLPFPNHPNLWDAKTGRHRHTLLLDSDWVLYKLSPNTPKWKTKRGLLDLYFSPPWRQVDTVRVQFQKGVET